MIINNMPVAVAQKKADIAVLLAEGQKEVQGFRILMEAAGGQTNLRYGDPFK
jgi:hypothetical protein